MQWRIVPSFPIYEVSENGDLRRLTSRGSRPAGFQLTPRRNVGGYLEYVLTIDGVTMKRRVHRLVAETFIGPQPSSRHQVAHGDGNQSNNHYSNLRWALPAENSADRVKHGTQTRGEASGTAKLLPEDVSRIREALFFGANQSQLARAYGVRQGTIWSIGAGRLWRHLPLAPIPLSDMYVTGQQAHVG
jgi:hypothetical protein